VESLAFSTAVGLPPGVTGPEPDAEALARLLEEMPVGLAIFEAPDRLVWANRKYRNDADADPSLRGAEGPGHAPGPAPLAPFTIALQGALLRGNTGAARWAVTGQRSRPTGVLVEAEVHPLASAPGGPNRAAVVLHELSEELTEHERARLFYASFLTSTNAIEITDRNGVLVDVNPAFERIYGYSRAECIGRKPNIVRSKKTPTELYERMWADLGDPRQGSWSGEILNRDRKGRERTVFLTISAVRDESGAATHYVGVAVDLTEQRSWERHAAHTDKLASIGQLAAGVAHEINTPLANIMLIAEGIRRRSPDASTLRRAEAIAEQARIAGEIVRGLLDFARRGEPRISDLDLVSVTRETLAFLRGKQSADVDVEERYPAGPVPIAGDRSQLGQVLTNIINNAYEALEHGGRIVVEVRATRDRAEVEVIDSGPGISEDALPHIFEPFFTTKVEGKGTGLGLAICHGIVQAHRGTIRVRNVPGAGASFTISLPRPNASSDPAPEPGRVPDPEPPGRTKNDPDAPG
jgi:PAS domain S-box-containing protein